MRITKHWTNEELQLIRDKYQDMGAVGVQKLMPYRARHSIVNKAYKLKIKWIRPKPKRTFCIDCGLEIFSNHKLSGKKYSSKSKYGRCWKCSNIAKRKPKPIKITKKYERDWTIDEINKLRNLYFTKSNKEIALILNRNESSISHKASRFKISKPRDYFVNRGKYGNFIKNNPMSNPKFKEKAQDTRKRNWVNGKIKLSGIALKSSLGLIRKENHPNWSGGISFLPYDKNWDEKFKKSILDRDKCCMICITPIKELKLINKQICVHHIDYNKLISIKENCITLCNSCHMKTNYNRSSWKKFFQSLMSDRYGYNYENN